MAEYGWGLLPIINFKVSSSLPSLEGLMHTARSNRAIVVKLK